MKDKANQIVKILLLLLVCAGLVVSFQNCGQAGFDNSDMAFDDLSSVDPKLSDLPFPYQISVNQIAYMSCPMTGTGVNDQYFTFRVGSYNNNEVPVDTMGLSTTGISLRQDYKDKFTEAVSFYNADFHDDKLAEALSSVPSGKYATPFLSVRSKSETKTYPFFGAGGTGTQQREMLGALSEPAYTQTFKDALNGQFSFFDKAKYTQGNKFKQLSGAITFSAQESQLQSQRSLLINQYLTVGFVNPNTQLSGFDSPVPFGPDSGNDLMYGRGFSFYFERPRVIYNSSASHKLVIGQEMDLETGNPVSATWDCSRSFKIVPQEIRNALTWVSGTQTMPICPTELYSELNNNVAKRQTYHLLRRFLNTEAWDINVTRGCIVPKIGGCYSAPDQVVYDEFFFATPQPTASPRQSAGCGGSGQLLCPHYLTLCVRRN